MVAPLITEKLTKRTLIVLFILAGISAMGIRWIYFGVDRISPEDTAWKITLNGQFEVIKDVTIITVLKPKTKKQNKLISQRFYHPGLKILTPSQSKPGLVHAKARQSGKTEFIAEYHIQQSQTPVLQTNKQIELSPIQREKYLQPDKIINLSLDELSILSTYLRKDLNSKSELTHKIYQHCQKLLKETNSEYDDLSLIVKQNKATTLGRARLMIALNRINDIPARLVTGLVLRDSVVKEPYYWVEVYDEENGWQAFDSEKGYNKTVPASYVAFGYDTPEIFSVNDETKLSVKFTISEDLEILDVERFKQDKNILDIFDFQRLDIDTRQALTLLLLLPFCVLLTAFLRHVLGLNPYGTFTAPLLSLAMVYAEMVVTLIVASIVIFLALLGRSILPKTLSRAPRLSLIFTFVALAMVLSVSVMSYFSIEQGGTIILLPTIILVSIVDRFYSYMDDVSAHAALIRLAITILIAFLCTPILQSDNLGTFILTFPEFHLITAALVLILSSYKGKKLTDHPYLALFGVVKTSKKTDKKSEQSNVDTK